MTEFKRIHAAIDGDPIKHKVASAGEKRTIKVVHRQTGDEYDLKTRTEWYGHWKKKAGGKLAELNAELSDDCKMLPEDFDIIDVQTPEPIANVLHTAKLFAESVIADTQAETFHMMIGKGASWRVGASTLLEYKGNRKDTIKPYHMDEVSDYLVRKFDAEVVEGMEVDDRLVIDTFGRAGHFAVGLEKDLYSSATHFLDTSNPEQGIQNGNQYGELYLNAKGDVKGIGRMHFMWQVCSEDSSDNYKANCFSDVKWGGKGAYEALKDAKNDRELFQAAVGVFKKLYPEPKIVTGWRGDQIEISWHYVMQEMMHMAWMKRKEHEPLVQLLPVLDKLGVEY